MILRIAVSLVALVAVVVAGFGIYVAARQNLKFDAPYPDITASTDSAVIARGRYVVHSLANCGACHRDTTRTADWMAGAEVPLSGGFTWDIPPGKIRARNLTPDDETGIGRFSDGAIARALRHGVGHDGRALLPFMELQGLSDEDITAIISYLRAQPPVHNLVPAHRYSLLGNVVKATVLANPVGPSGTPPTASPRGASEETGRYLVGSVALCWACHTQRDMATGALVGSRFGGSTGFTEPDQPGVSWSPPNITADSATGRLGNWSEDDFVMRFRAGRLIPHSPMPWQGLQKLDEDDLRSMYRYLKSLPPVKNDVGPPLVVLERK